MTLLHTVSFIQVLACNSSTIYIIFLVFFDREVFFFFYFVHVRFTGCSALIFLEETRKRLLYRGVIEKERLCVLLTFSLIFSDFFLFWNFFPLSPFFISSSYCNFFFIAAVIDKIYCTIRVKKV